MVSHICVSQKRPNSVKNFRSTQIWVPLLLPACHVRTQSLQLYFFVIGVHINVTIYGLNACGWLPACSRTSLSTQSEQKKTIFIVSKFYFILTMTLVYAAEKEDCRRWRRRPQAMNGNSTRERKKNIRPLSKTKPHLR